MKKTTRALIALVAGSLAAFASATTAATGATGNGAPSGGHYNLNVIGVPKGKTASSMTGSNRHTIFVPLQGSCQVELVVGEFNVADGNCTDDGKAKFSLPNPDSNGDGTTDYSVFTRALGTPGGSSTTTTCATDPYDGSRVCSDISLTLTRTTGRTQFTNASKYLFYIYADYNDDGTADRLALFDSRLQDYFWAYDNTGLKLAQLRFYDCQTTVPAASDPTGAQTSTC